jgi:hypothetical protein
MQMDISYQIFLQNIQTHFICAFRVIYYVVLHNMHFWH